jgi:chromosome segregation ATPase
MLTQPGSLAQQWTPDSEVFRVPEEIIKYILGGGLVGLLTAWLGLRKARKEDRTDRLTQENLAAGHLATLSQTLLNERKDREADVERLQDRISELFETVEGLRGDLLERDAMIAELRRESIIDKALIVSLTEDCQRKDQKIELLQGEIRQQEGIVTSAKSIQLRAAQAKAKDE